MSLRNIVADDLVVGAVLVPSKAYLEDYPNSPMESVIESVNPHLIDRWGKGELYFTEPSGDDCVCFSFDYVIEHYRIKA